MSKRPATVEELVEFHRANYTANLKKQEPEPDFNQDEFDKYQQNAAKLHRETEEAMNAAGVYSRMQLIHRPHTPALSGSNSGPPNKCRPQTSEFFASVIRNGPWR